MPTNNTAASTWAAQGYNGYMEWNERITIGPGVLVGKPVVRGTRLAVEFIVGLLAEGWTEVEIIENYPNLTREDIRACLEYDCVAALDAENTSIRGNGSS